MKKILVVVDMQNDFVDENVLGNAECKAVIPKIKEKIENGQYDHIIFTKDTHNDDYLETQEGKNLPVKHCILGSDGWALVKEINDAAKNSSAKTIEYITKDTFGSKELGQSIADIKEDKEVEMVGVCTGICVISNALLIKAFNPEVKITVDSNCCACVTPKSHETALEAMKLCQINII